MPQDSKTSPGVRPQTNSPKDSTREEGVAPPSSHPTKFAKADEALPKRGPGRPPKISPPRGVPANAGTRAAEAQAAGPALAPAYSAKPDPGMAAAGVRGLLQMTSAISATITHFALKLDFAECFKLWQFSEAELRGIEGPGARFLEKYTPALDVYGVELEFAAAFLPVFSAKVFAIIAAKRALQDQQKFEPPVRQPAQPSVSSAEARSSAPREESPSATRNTPSPEAASAASGDSSGALPSAFTNQEIDREAELVMM